MPTHVLPALPPMGAAFARALVPSRSGPAQIPESSVAVHGHRQDAARYADYSRVCGFTLRDAVPPTWLHVLTFPLHVHLLSARDSSVRLVGAVHVANSMTLHREVDVAQPLDIEVRAEHLRPHRRGALIDLVGSIRVDDDTVWEGVSTYLATGMDVPGEPGQPTRDDWEPVTPQATWRLPANLGRQYRRVSHDPNPIHVSRVAAKAFGFPRPIMHGMWSHARALAALEGRLPAAYSAHVDFVKPVFLPGTVGFTSRETESGGWEASVTTRDGAKPHLRMSVR